MADPTPEMADRHRRILVRLSELSLEAAENLHNRLIEAQAPAEAQGLGVAFEKVSRSLRLTLLLEAKLEKDALAAQREVEALQARAAEALYAVRRARVRSAVIDAIAEASERPEEAEELADTLDANLDSYLRDPEFAAMPFEDVVDRLCRDLGLDDEDEDEDGDAAEDGDAPAPPDAPGALMAEAANDSAADAARSATPDSS
jgi:hypothetical protein